MVVGPEIEAKVFGLVMEKLLHPVTRVAAPTDKTISSAKFNAQIRSGLARIRSDLARTNAPRSGDTKEQGIPKCGNKG